MPRTQDASADLQLTRVPGDRRRYALLGIGSLRLQGLLGRRATAEAGSQRWTFVHRGFWRREVEATDETGAVAGAFLPRAIRRGGTLRWGDRELALAPASTWRERYALSDGDHQLMLLDGKGWGARPVRLTLAGQESLDPGLVLFAAFVVRGLAEDASSSAGAGASVAVC